MLALGLRALGRLFDRRVAMGGAAGDLEGSSDPSDERELLSALPGVHWGGDDVGSLGLGDISLLPLGRFV